jgi:ribonuclease HI
VPWHSRLLRGERVFVKVNPRGEPAAGSDGRVDIRYRAGGKVYRAGVRNLEADPDPQKLDDAEAAGPSGGAGGGSDAGAAAGGGRGGDGARAGKLPADAIIVYTDGACTGNPGPAGLGVVILDGKERREVSEYLGNGTNNIAELMAIVRALELTPRDRTVVIHADSAYALGLLGKGWKAKANQQLVERMRAVAREHSDLRLVKVAGHAGVSENERADELARMAIARGR